MDHTVSPQSRATYSRQGGRLLDLCMVDNSHSVASASSDGTVHVSGTRACCYHDTGKLCGGLLFVERLQYAVAF